LLGGAAKVLGPRLGASDPGFGDPAVPPGETTPAADTATADQPAAPAGTSQDTAAPTGHAQDTATSTAAAPEAAGDAGPALSRVFRVEGPGNARLNIDPAGNVSIKGNNAMFLNFGQEARAQQFLQLRLSQGFEGTQIKSFQIPTSYLG